MICGTADACGMVWKRQPWTLYESSSICRSSISPIIALARLTGSVMVTLSSLMVSMMSRTIRSASSSIYRDVRLAGIRFWIRICNGCLAYSSLAPWPNYRWVPSPRISLVRAWRPSGLDAAHRAVISTPVSKTTLSVIGEDAPRFRF